jgi:hypothetical protein
MARDEIQRAGGNNSIGTALTWFRPSSRIYLWGMKIHNCSNEFQKFLFNFANKKDTICTSLYPDVADHQILLSRTKIYKFYLQPPVKLCVNNSVNPSLEHQR